jgi:N-acetylmuramoyl-L-alanine amidase
VIRRLHPFVVSMVLGALAALPACSSGGSSSAMERATTSAPSTTSTTAAPVTTTTTAAPPPVAGDVKALTTTRGVVVPVYGGAAGAWEIGTPCGGRSVVRGGVPITGTTVVIDPGHGGVETGAVGPNGLSEKDLNLVVAQRVATDLVGQGISVVLTRTADYRVPLDARSALVMRLQPQVFVSVHHNGGPDGPAAEPGTETYYQHASPASKRLAGLAYEEVFRVFGGFAGVTWHGNVDAGAKWRLNSRGGDYYGVLRATAGVPSIISEGLFLSSSPAEAALLARPDVQVAEANALARAVVRYLRSRDAGSGFVTPIERKTPAVGGGAEACVDPTLE